MSLSSSSNEETRTEYVILIGKILGKWPLERPRRRQGNNSKMVLREDVVRMLIRFN
jgi:hypothetical protein